MSLDRSSFIDKSLKEATHVVLKANAVKPPLPPPYVRPYRVLKRDDKMITIDINGKSKTVLSVWQQFEKVRKKRSIISSFPDPLYSKQWYLNGGADDGLDMNVEPVWARGYTGKGVVVSILDDGIQTNHPDLRDNYDPMASYDINEEDGDPMPRDDGDNKHGTRCAGEVAGQAFNSYCGIGVAYNASIGGVRMLDGVVNDAVEARALSLNPQHIDIYSASWGPEDDGKTVDGPGPLATRAFLNGISKGRGGKGSIFVWASGNGGRHTDSCSCDGYTNSIYTLSISSATQAGMKPWYLEECSSTIASTFSSGTLGRDKSVTTSDMDAKLRPDRICTTDHTGTSASAPIAAGMCALALEANPSLTWRDMQHIVVLSARSKPLDKEEGWIVNGANKKVSHKFGFGLMDGDAMVSLAEQWTSVPPQHLYKTPQLLEERTVEGTGVIVDMNVSYAGGVRYLEHVECVVSVSFSPRGSLQLVLTSPQGTPSTLLQRRPRDTGSTAFDDWPFLSVHYWGEDPRGTWTLTVLNLGQNDLTSTGVLKKWQLVFYGTDTNPINLHPLQPFQSFKPQPPDTFNEIAEDDGDEVRPEGERLADCHSECDAKGCYSSKPTDCVSCLNFRIERKCVEKCPDGYYGLGKTCQHCHSNCATCIGSGPADCLQCSKSFFFVTDLGLCVRSCPKTYFEDMESAKCISCRDNCASCDQNPSTCSSCEQHLVLHNGSCLASCPKGTYEDHFRRCSPCYGSCRYCTGGNPRDCLDSSKGPPPCTGRLCTKQCPKQLYWQNGACVPACPQGFYGWKGECKRCWGGCATCFGGRRDECVSCLPGWTLGQGQCRLHCPRNMYSAGNGCVKCHHFCFTCNGGGAYGCTQCANGRYMDESTGLCAPCTGHCRTCQSQGACSSCHPHMTLVGDACLPTHHSNRALDSFSSNLTADDTYRSTGKRMRSSSEAVDRPDDRSVGSHLFEYSPFVTLTVITVIACVAIIILFALMFITLQPNRTPEPRTERRAKSVIVHQKCSSDRVSLVSNTRLGSSDKPTIL